jgi:hypothetical protein
MSRARPDAKSDLDSEVAVLSAQDLILVNDKSMRITPTLMVMPSDHRASATSKPVPLLFI